MLNSSETKDFPVSGGLDGSIPWGAMIPLIIGGFMAILDGSIVNVALPRIMTIFGSTPSEIQWVLTGYLLTSGVVVPVTGYLGDRFGNKRMYIFTLAIFIFGSAACGLAWSAKSLIIARIFQAIGGGMMMPVSMAMIYNIVPRDKIGMALGVWGIAAMAAPAIGPTTGGYLVDNFDWRLIFTINIPVGAIAIFLSIISLKETPRHPGLKLDLPGCILSTAGCFAMLLALSEGQSKGWTSFYIVSLLVFAAFSIILFIWWELITPEPVLDIRLLKNKVFSFSLGASAIVTIGMFSAIFLIPLFAQNVQGYTPMQTGLMLMPMAIVTGLIMPLSGRLFDKIGALPLCLVGLTAAVVATYYLHVLNINTSFHWLQVMLVIRAMGIGLCLMPMSMAGMNTVPQFLIGRASALNNLVRQIAASFGIALLTHIMLQKQVYHAVRFAEAVNMSSPVFQEMQYRVQTLQLQAGIGDYLSQSGLIALIYGVVLRTSAAAGIADAFVIAALIMVLAFPLIFFLSKKHVEESRVKEARRYGVKN